MVGVLQGPHAWGYGGATIMIRVGVRVSVRVRVRVRLRDRVRSG